MSKSALFLGIIVLVLASVPGWAQIATTGQLSGQVEDEKGEPLPGVTVTATSDALQGARAVVTSADGKFTLPLLPVGAYKLAFKMDGYQGLSLEDVRVQLGAILPVKVKMKEGQLVENVTVTSNFPLIQPKTADLSTNFSGAKLDSIPTAARTFTDLARFVPSITSTEFNSTDPTGQAPPAPSIRGEGQYGDNYLIDGLSVRDPSVKTAGTPLPFNAIEEVQIVTDGFSPEYGQSLGGIINVITKTGSNRLAGSVAYIYSDDSMAADFRQTEVAQQSDFEKSDPYVDIGGPILKDRLWYFASYGPNTEDNGFAPKHSSAVDIEDGTEEFDGDIYFGKLTFAATPKHTVAGNYTYRQEDGNGLDAGSATAEARFDQEIEDDRYRLNYNAIFSANSLFELKLGKVNRQIEAFPLSSRGPAQYEVSDADIKINNTWRQTFDEREREDLALTFTQFWNPGGKAGSHEFKIGYDQRDLNQDSGDQFTGLDEDIWPDTFDQGVKYQFVCDNCETPTEMLTPTVANNYRSSGILNNENEEWGGFIQDRWEVGKWNFLLGARVDQQEGFNDAGDTYYKYDPQDAIGPRLSVTWDSTGDGKNVFKTGWGRFYDAESLRLGEFANTRESFSFRSYGWVGGFDDDGNPDTPLVQEDFRDHIDDGSVFDIHNPSNWAFVNEQSNEANPLDYSALDQPPQLDRFLLEYDRQLGNNYVLKGRFVDGETRELIDDVHFFYNDFRVLNTNLKRRDYHSVEFEFNGNPTPEISFTTSYVHSTAKGTNPGQFELAGFQGSAGSGNDIGVFLDRPPSNPQGWCDLFGPDCVPASWVNIAGRDYDNDEDVDQFDRDLFIQTLFAGLGGIDGDDGWYGYLPYSIDDLIKLQGRFVIPQWRDAYINAFFQWASGYRNDRNGFQALYGDFLTFSEAPGDFVTSGDDPGTPLVDECFDVPGNFGICSNAIVQDPVAGQNFTRQSGLRRGSIEGPAFWTLDLAVGKVFSFGKSYSLELRGELFNAFNNQEILAPQDRAVSTFGNALTRQFPRSGHVFVRFAF